MELRVEEFDVGPSADGYFFVDHSDDLAALAVNPELPSFVKRSCEIQAHGHLKKRPPKGGRRFIVEVEEPEDLDPNAILAIRSVIEDLQPGWVEEVKEACRLANHPRVIAGWCELSLSVVVAIIENLKARGELPED
ncbi:hypothetical protein [Rubrobacter calidifluminis]|uniref:hypothetical protein n=1 Tax=Rubrobacter calidifluminis TaxID=1392640 RepID=UPI0023616185|nr:hypothetical protein [Rubrobacter calidifluminis]